MTWIKLDDSFPNHPKIRKAGPEASWLYVAALCHSGQFLTDGFIDADMVPMLTSIKALKKAIESLVRNKLWIEVKGGYQINSFEDYQRTRGQVERERGRARERQARSRRSHDVTEPDVTGVSRRDIGVTHSEVTAPSRRESQRSHSTDKSRVETDTPPNPLASEGGPAAEAAAGDHSPPRQNPRALGRSPRQQAEAERLASTPCPQCRTIHDPSFEHDQCDSCGGFGYVETESDDETTFEACTSCNRTGRKVVLEASTA